jgi:hypothetical protein
VIETWRYHRAAAIVMRNACFAVAGALGVSIILLAFFIYKGAFHDLVECTITYNFYYGQIGSNNLDFFISMIVFLAEQWWPLILLCGWFLYKRRPRWAVIGVLFTASLATASQDTNGHYYLLMVPFLAILVASALDSFLSWLGTRVHSETKQKALGWLIPVVVILILLMPLRGMMLLRPDELVDTVYWGNPFFESSIVAQRVRELLPEHEPLFVAGSEPQILFYSKRMSLSRFDIMYPLTMPTPFMKRYQDEVKEALRKSPPKVAVFALPRMSWFYKTSDFPEFRFYVERMLRSADYSLVGGYMRAGHRKGWVEPLRYEDIPQCTLIVLRRKQPDSR